METREQNDMRRLSALRSALQRISDFQNPLVLSHNGLYYMPASRDELPGVYRGIALEALAADEEIAESFPTAVATDRMVEPEVEAAGIEPACLFPPEIASEQGFS